jgi:hypothetical protein
LSSMFNVVLICMMMHHLCIHVNSKFAVEKPVVL